MKVFVAGATGALGRNLVPMLVAAGHDVTGSSRSAAKGELIESLGARAVALDVLDPDAVSRALSEAGPDVVIHQATALSDSIDFRNFDKSFATTNRLRTEGTRNLLRAAQAAGAERFIAQSFAGWPYARTGGWVKDEDAPLDQDPPKRMTETLGAIRELERIVTSAKEIDGIVLRYGGFYGPETSIAPGGEQYEALQAGKFPLVGSADGYASLIHIEDAAAATALAAERGEPGIYNVVDDEPAPAREWVPGLAEAIGAKPPRRVPAWLARLVAGGAVVTMMTGGRAASNAKARRELGWEPRFPSWRQGFAEGMG